MFGIKKKKIEIIDYDELGKKIKAQDLADELIKQVGPIPPPPPLEKEREDFLIIVDVLNKINDTLKEIKQSLDSYRAAIVRPITQPINIEPPKNKGGRPRKNV